MECASDGTIIRVRELNTNFTIPKRKLPDSLNDNNAEKQEPTSSIEPQSILNSNPQYDWTQNCYQYCDGVEQRKAGGLKRIHEEPKNHKTYKDTFGDMCDSSLPKELRDQFQPLFCKLCTAQLGSTVNAKLHYASRNHDKKVRKFLVEYSERTGEPLHKRAKEQRTKVVDEEYNPRYFHCEACDLPLTGKIHAESHYMGKNHQKVVSGKKQPAGKGQYNENGEWKRSMMKTDLSGRNGIGQDFAAVEKHPEAATSLRCDLCQVSVTSLPQMDMHLQGQRHMKKLKANGLQPQVETAPSPLPVFASYRTPSGQYYCKVCNVSMNSESQFTTHLQSKNHSKKQAAAKE